MGMDFIERFFLYLSLVSFICLIIGLFKPWMMLWWEDRQNRKKILKVYGSATVGAMLLYLTLHYLSL